jgi:ribosomal protein S18 acetylase RimI-like enzyme
VWIFKETSLLGRTRHSGWNRVDIQGDLTAWPNSTQRVESCGCSRRPHCLAEHDTAGGVVWMFRETSLLGRSSWSRVDVQGDSTAWPKHDIAGGVVLIIKETSLLGRTQPSGWSRVDVQGDLTVWPKLVDSCGCSRRQHCLAEARHSGWSRIDVQGNLTAWPNTTQRVKSFGCSRRPHCLAEAGGVVWMFKETSLLGRTRHSRCSLVDVQGYLTAWPKHDTADGDL